MKKQIALLIIGLFSMMSFAQKTPTYSNYTVKVVKKTAKKVNLKSHPKAKEYRTRLQGALADEDVNFAGKYILAQWGCGTSCIQAGIIDAQTGTVYLPVVLQWVTRGYNPALEDYEMVEFRKNSKLLIINGAAGYDKKETQEGFWYYEWTGKDFKLLKFIKK
ncbi:MAG: hypothetical protein PHC28_09230 [Flavobacterium sp.]|uniref:hypothetical protein n=1 Tax=Flavobacterium sp. TaxID=239 RepID=UPI00261F7BB1|nr:hypothetical protein [Flavobacterium sp.]MDD5150651.1 hypothetical protein [Flavobacterium sp.]